MNMGIEPFLVATSVHLICAQRLVRRICKDCAEPVEMPPQALIDDRFHLAIRLLRNFALLLGHDDVAKLFKATLEEESATDKKLAALAATINPQAENEGE